MYNKTNYNTGKGEFNKNSTYNEKQNIEQIKYTKTNCLSLFTNMDSSWGCVFNQWVIFTFCSYPDLRNLFLNGSTSASSAGTSSMIFLFVVGRTSFNTVFPAEYLRCSPSRQRKNTRMNDNCHLFSKWRRKKPIHEQGVFILITRINKVHVADPLLHTTYKKHMYNKYSNVGGHPKTMFWPPYYKRICKRLASE